MFCFSGSDTSFVHGMVPLLDVEVVHIRVLTIRLPCTSNVLAMYWQCTVDWLVI